MKKLLISLAAVFAAFAAAAEEPGPGTAEVRAAVEAFNGAYAGNRVEEYFGYYVDDATLYFYGARQTVSAYHEEWAQTIADGGRVEKYDLSDIQVRMLPGGEAAYATYLVDYRMRARDGSVSDAKAFESDLWQKIDGEWKVVALHYTEISGGG